jgi:lipoate---protein ligase
VTHELFCDSLEQSFAKKWESLPLNKVVLKEDNLRQIPELMKLYESYSKWEWRFGETPAFTNGLEHKFAWALVDVQFEVKKGVISKG